jgi:hypothetical protein
MDYKKHYNRLIERARNRKLDCYTENHHIIPRCMGGGNKKSNLVRLTAEEHYIAHILLVKIYPSETKLIYAANMMSNRNNKVYGVFKRKHAELVSKDKTGTKHKDSSRRKMSVSRMGIPKDNSHKRKISEAHKKNIEYKGSYYKGYNDLLEKTGVSRHNYLKYYANGIDPEPFVGNNTWGMIKISKENHPKNAKGMKWINDGKTEKYISKDEEVPNDWFVGRLKKRENKCSNR